MLVDVGTCLVFCTWKERVCIGVDVCGIVDGSVGVGVLMVC